MFSIFTIIQKKNDTFLPPDMHTLADISILQPTDTLIVANNRQVLAIKQQWHTLFGTAALPDITTISALVKTQSRCKILSEFEMYTLFTTFLHHHHITTDGRATAEVLQSYNKLRQYHIALQDIAFPTEREQIFIQVVQAYEHYKQAHHAQDIFDAYADVVPTAKKYYYFGFKSLNTLDMELLERLGSKELPSQTLTHTTSAYQFSSVEDEVQAVVQWASEIHQKHPEKSIVIVHPQLETWRHRLSYAFNAYYNEFRIQTKEKSFNISLGKPLWHYKLAVQFYQVLCLEQQLAGGKLTPAYLHALAQSPYCALSDTLMEYIDYSANEVEIAHLQDKEELLDAILNAPEHYPQQSYTQWLATFERIFTKWHFLTGVQLSSDEYQLLEKIKQELRVFYSFEEQLVSFKTMLSLVYTLFHQQLFSPQSGEGQIQIMGALEAEGLRFDCAWIMGVTSEVFPTPLAPPTYLPLSVCRAHNVVHCDFAHNLRDAEQSLQVLLALAPEVHYSYGQLAEDVEVLPSTLVSWPAEVTAVAPVHTRISLERAKLSQQAPPLTLTTLKSAVRTIKAQHLCPFQGFSLRLALPEEKRESIGLSPQEKGTILHRALELCYQYIPSSKVLHNLSETEEEALINSSIQQAMKDIIPSSFKDIEILRMQRIMQNFLLLEKQRPDFSVQALEENKVLEIAGVRCHLRVDRVDVDEEGRVIIFDYKTSGVSVKSICESLQEVQLPLYTLSIQSDALAFVELRDEVKYKYIADDKLLPGNIKVHQCEYDYSQQQQVWREQLSAIVSDFLAGKAEVTPSPEGCKYCQLSSLCRKNES